MVLYVKPGDPVSMQAQQMVGDFQEILVQDVTQINQRPQWLSGVPTVVKVSDNTVYTGIHAFQILSSYITTIKNMAGAQDRMVINNNKGYAIADKNIHQFASIDNSRAAPPVGESNHHQLKVGQVNFATDDDPRYYQPGKVTEQEITTYTNMRNQKRERPVQLKPSVLENGEMVTM